ncbi:Hypothetical predicted protein [Mytilus galloprovincialis]|uniref:EGF-like domain-containing protein n=1 Tax=Mytilus galloprovincialis TaxID=29158 RepID=A0A8B6GEP2_MYTGA|nr:Hypothetical predicted protein [Mytilus galloprovincialis]
MAICRPSCGNGGQCTSPGVCSCTGGFTGYRCNGGDCVTGSCVCSTEFSGSSCLTVTEEVSFKPIINRCNATFTFHDYAKAMDIYSYFGDATELDEPHILWSNQNDFNILEMTMEVQYDTEYNGSQSLPDYVSSMKLGITNAKVETQHFKIGSGGLHNLVNTYTYTCNEPSHDNPISNEVFVCQMQGSNNFRIDSADRFVLTFSATAGGLRRLRNRDTGQVYPSQNYSEKTTSKIIEFKFDYMTPIHCIEQSTPCTDKQPLHISEDITQNSIVPKWDGWLDELSQIMKYSIEVWKMEYSMDLDNLREPLITTTVNPIPVFIQEFNETDTNIIQYPTFSPTEPGVYSCILEVSDRANNTRYARRFVLYDNTSEVTTQNENPMKCTTASSSTGYTWQTNGDKTVQISWTDHFINTVHANGHFLNSISAYAARLTDSGRRNDYKNIENKFDDYEGKMNRNGINNINGIVQFEFAYQSPSSNVSNLSWTDLGLLENIILTLPSSEDGFSQMFWVRAIDAIVLLNRPELAEIFWKQDEDNIFAALYASSLAKKLSESACSREYTEIKAEFAKSSIYYEDIAYKVMTTLYGKHASNARKLLVTKNEKYGFTTIFELTDSNSLMRFMGHTACQTQLNIIWKGDILPYTSDLKVICGAFLPVLIPNMMKKDEKGNSSKRSPPSSLNASYSTKSSKSMTSTFDSKTFAENNQKKEAGHSKAVAFYNRIKRIYNFYNAPVTKFVFNVVAYIIFLLVFSFFVLTDLHPLYEKGISFAEYLTCGWAASMMIEELRQVYLPPLSFLYSKSKLRVRNNT